MADPTNGRARQITRTPVLATLVTTFEWTADGKKIATVLVPDGRGADARGAGPAHGPAR